jgi:hypothetical protein
VIVAIESHQGAIDMQVTTIGLDIAKNVFQVHGIDAAEKVVHNAALAPNNRHLIKPRKTQLGLCRRQGCCDLIEVNDSIFPLSHLNPNPPDGALISVTLFPIQIWASAPDLDRARYRWPT